MAFTIPNTIAQALANQYDVEVNTGAGTAQVIVYDATGGVPAVETAISTQVTLAEVDLDIPAFDTATDANPGASIALAGVPQSDNSINATGTAAFFRIIDRNGDVVGQGTVGTSSTDMIVNSVSFQSGATFTITSLVLTFPES